MSSTTIPRPAGATLTARALARLAVQKHVGNVFLKLGLRHPTSRTAGCSRS